MLNYVPKYFTNKAIALYFIALAVVSVVFMNNMIQLRFIPFGIAAAVGFFYFSNTFTKKWNNYSEKKFIKKLFITALAIRAVWVVFSYFYYITQTGTPFDWGFGDAWGYHLCAEEIAAGLREGNWAIFAVYLDIFGPSDFGYMSYLGVLYWFTGDSIMIARLIKALLSAFMCVLIYKLTTRNFGESTGRIAGVLAMLMPHFIYYCGGHLKETEMIFLAVAFVERADYLLRSKNFNFVNIAIPIVLAASLFFFRTILGLTALMTFFTAIVFSPGRVVNWKQRILVGAWVVAMVGYFLGGQIATEVEIIWEGRDTHLDESREFRAERRYGNEFARYAGAAVFAPMIFTIPFPTMVNIEHQPVQQMLNGTNFVKNITSFFTILGIFLLVYRKQWRKHLLVLTFLICYLGILANTGFAHSERFHLPSVPFALIIAAYGISQMDNEKKKYFNWWTMLIFVAIVVWSWFKLAGRGM